jgi:pyruvate dehydrogenase (quinone)/pyruvate oxidase
MARPTAADVLVDTLIDWGVDTIFGVPADGINGIIEALRTQQRTVEVCPDTPNDQDNRNRYARCY